jgi:2-polyprenyl-6-methoxyphenol hydroxylase-like FAD-dependent oxidoreductase
LDGLDESVHFGKKFVSFEHEPDGRVTARFADGSQATADLLVGADGANSLVRAQLLPGAGRTETGIVAVGGKLAINQAVHAAIPPVLMRGPTPILGPNGCFMFVSAMQSADLGAARPGERRLARSSSNDGRGDYMMWGFSARRERFGTRDAVERLDGRKLKGLVEGLMTAWGAPLRDLVESSDPATITAFSVKASTPVRPWKTTNVTLLGDAVHNMPPYRGVGANAALWDAALLRDKVVRVARGDCPLLEGLSDYERRMIAHGFRACADVARRHEAVSRREAAFPVPDEGFSARRRSPSAAASVDVRRALTKGGPVSVPAKIAAANRKASPGRAQPWVIRSRCPGCTLRRGLARKSHRKAATRTYMRSGSAARRQLRRKATARPRPERAAASLLSCRKTRMSPLRANVLHAR